MLKNKIIVSKLFDTINKLAANEIEEEKEEPCEEIAVVEGRSNEYRVSIPNEDKLLKFTNEKPLMICIYGIRTDGLYPFIVYLLHKAEPAQVTFIAMPVQGLKCSGTGSKKIKYAVQAYLRLILPDLAFTYTGFFEARENNIVIYKCAEPDTEMSDYIWATAYELFNRKQVMDYTLHNSITSFFCLNPDFLILKTPTQRIYESPMIGYYSSMETCAVSEMDIYRETIIPALGKCYYLFQEIPHKHRQTNILRIVFFAGRMDLYADNVSDSVSDSVYDSLFCREYKRYIIQNYNQHVVLI